MNWCVLLCLLFSFLALVCSQNINLTTKKGDIIGIRRDPNPATNVSYDAFIGIPYGKIPARFQLAVPRDSWSTPLVTQTDGPACPQIGLPYDEDCLYINVYTPKGASTNPVKLPVMVFIHGSAFLVGSSSSKFYGPDFLIPQNVILVTMNYRLGAVGFLTLGSKVAPGNQGLQDTLLALQWVQDEISAFGGDPAQVTLFGQSAGAIMTQFHYLSALSTGLFSKAISESGSALEQWVVFSPEESARRARLLAQRLHCNTSLDDSALLACLQAAEIGDVVNNQFITLPTNILVAGLNLPFMPVNDSHLTSERPFFNDSLANLMKAATIRAKPLLAGFNTDEGILKFSDNMWRQAEDNMTYFIPETVKLSDDQITAVVKDIKSRYFPDTVDDNKVHDLVRLYTHTMFAFSSVKMMRHFANLTYGYVFAYYGPWSPPPTYFKYNLKGVCHGAELSYLFYISIGVQDLESCTLNKPNLEMRDKMVEWWTTFAKTGAPDSSWQTISKGNHYLTIDSTNSFVNVSNFENQYYDFWAKIEAMTSAAHGNLSFMSLLLLLFFGLQKFF